MCAEAVPWRCHRSLVADALSVRGVPVVEILSESSYRMHKLTPFAQVEGVRITYLSGKLHCCKPRQSARRCRAATGRVTLAMRPWPARSSTCRRR
jgi:hypothetical protein